jgi:hypothetical protein
VLAVATEAAADIYVLSGAINGRSADELISCVRVCEKRRPNAILALATDGGSADAAYRIARTLKRHHKRLILLVFGESYSAGTLVAVVTTKPSCNCLSCADVAWLKLSILHASDGMSACNWSSFSAPLNFSASMIWRIFSSMVIIAIAARPRHALL